MRCFNDGLVCVERAFPLPSLHLYDIYEIIYFGLDTIVIIMQAAIEQYCTVAQSMVILWNTWTGKYLSVYNTGNLNADDGPSYDVL